MYAIRYLILLISLICPAVVLSQSYYVDASKGSDFNSGISPDSAWKTLSALKIQGQRKGFLPGDRVLLKKGEIWNETLYIFGEGNEDHNVIYGSYGKGNKPKIIKGIYHRDYMHKLSPLKRNEFITIEDIEVTGAKEGLDIRSINHITVRNIDITNCQTGITLASETDPLDNWLIENVRVKNCKGYGLFSYSDINHMTVRKLETAYNGKDGAAFRTGENNWIEDSIAHHNGEDGFDVGGFTGKTSFIRCVSWENRSAGFSIKAKGKGQATTNILYCISYKNGDQGLEVGNDSNSNTYNSVFFSNGHIGIDLENQYHHSISNSIIFGNGESHPNGFQVSYLRGAQKLVTSSNCYGVQSKGRNIYVKKEKRFLNLEEWQAYSENQYDSGSMVADPDFINSDRGLFELKPDSPCIDMGRQLSSDLKYGIAPGSVWVNSVNVLDQNLYGSGWEIGAFVYK